MWSAFGSSTGLRFANWLRLAEGPVCYAAPLLWVLVAVGLWRRWAPAALLAFASFPLAVYLGTSLAPPRDFLELAAWGPGPVAAFVALGPGQSSGTFTAIGIQWLWCAPLLIAPLRGGWLRARAGMREKARRGRLDIPSDIGLRYVDNPFGVLGLAPSAVSTRSLLRRKNELTALLNAEMVPQESLAEWAGVHWPGQPPLDATRVGKAVALLQDERERYRREAQWFQWDDEPAEALSGLALGDFSKAEQHWESLRESAVGKVGRKRRRRSGPADEVKSARAVWNLAILSHARAIASERESAPPHSRANYELWQRSMALWSEALGNPAALRFLEHQHRNPTDLRADEPFFRKLRASLPQSVLSVNLAYARAGAEQGFAEYAAFHLDLVESAKLPDAAKEAARAEPFQPLAEKARALLSPLLLEPQALIDRDDLPELTRCYQALRDLLAALRESRRLCPIADQAIDLAAPRVAERVITASNRFHQADSAFALQTTGLIDAWNSAHSHEALRRVLGLMEPRRDELRELEAKRDEVVTTVAKAQRALDLLDAVASDGSDGQSEKLQTHRKDAQESVSVARREFGKTKEHFERNLNSMSSQLAG